MIKDWSLYNITQEIDKISYGESDPRMDGFTAWGCKQDLYQILWYVEDKLKECGTYTYEPEYVRQREIKKMWDILKSDD